MCYSAPMSDRNRKIREGLQTTVDVVRTAGIVVQFLRTIANLFRRKSRRVCPRTGQRLNQ